MIVSIFLIHMLKERVIIGSYKGNLSGFII